MQMMHGVKQHRAPNSPDQRHEPTASAMVLGAFPHRALHREGNEQGKCLQEPQKRVVGVHHSAASIPQSSPELPSTRKSENHSGACSGLGGTLRVDRCSITRHAQIVEGPEGSMTTMELFVDDPDEVFRIGHELFPGRRLAAVNHEDEDEEE